ncbi:heparinase II/III domain-containing protein [Phytoactinopolyspora endophytica]|uniref:heparinase II/III domain-containing protein n=1 Tax=Phytoactinopolyspora endophytica TaxID=1642495 RepID=UPI0013EB4A95|nr:heparinase II/III family protein [Phytoactinopolyspora endophytica]
MSDHDVERVRALAHRPGHQAKLYTALLGRARQWTETPGVTTADGVMQWWHVVWERLIDVAAAHRFEPDEIRASWLRNEILAICARPADDWVGPFFRPRTDPPAGMLETAHITLAVTTVASLCPELFSDGEHERIRETIRQRGQLLCKRALDNRLGTDARRGLNNWFMVMLNGYGTASVFLEDGPAIEETVERFGIATTLYESDSYGESLQYWNYASGQLAHLYEVLVQHRSALAQRLDHDGYTRCIRWVVNSHLYIKPLAGWGEASLPRALNFGDSAAIFRPTADLLLHIASRARDTHPVDAGLARWLFDQTYAEPQLGPVEGDSFGFANKFRWSSLLMLDDTAPAIAPEEAKLHTAEGFACGTVAVRDQWHEPTTILGIQGGHEPLTTHSHRHADQNSFILAHRDERFFADPGHCCYRLAAQWASTRTRSHSTWTFERPDLPGDLIEQRKPRAGDAASNRLTLLRQRDGVVVVRSDAAAAYRGEHDDDAGQDAPARHAIQRAERTWIAVLPHLVIIVDRIEAATPIRINSHFVLNNRDNVLRTNIAADTKLVFRRRTAAAKLFQLAAISDGITGRSRLDRAWGYMHDVYHPEPNQPGQSREGASHIYTFAGTEPAKTHTMIYGIVLDAETGIRQWHMTGTLDDGFTFDRNGEVLWRLRADNDEILLLEHVAHGCAYRIDSDLTVESPGGSGVDRD